MTAPVPTDEELAYEAAAVTAIVGPVAASVAAAVASASVGVAAGVGSVLLARALAERLRRIRWASMDARLPDLFADSADKGIRAALDTLPPALHPDKVTRTRADSLPDMDGPLRERLSEAADMADKVPDMDASALDKIRGRAMSGVHRAQASVRWTVNHGINSGVSDTAREIGARVLWVAERNACLDCLAYAGWATEPDQAFPAGLTFDPRGPRVKAYGPLMHPPLHPNCRCRVALHDGPAGPPPPDRSLADPAARLAGEARRSVVYQWSDYASKSAGERAASALLDAGAGLADSVEKRARAALRRGTGVRRPK